MPVAYVEIKKNVGSNGENKVITNIEKKCYCECLRNTTMTDTKEGKYTRGKCECWK